MRKIDLKTISVYVALLLCVATPVTTAHAQSGQKAGAKRSKVKGKAVPKGSSELDDDFSPKSKEKPSGQSGVGNNGKINSQEISDRSADSDTQADSAPANTPAPRTEPSAAPPVGTPAQGLEGKIGDVLSDGKWRFQVLDMRWLNSYAMTTGAEPTTAYNDDVAKWSSTVRVFLPKPGYKLILIQCRAVNVLSQKRTLWVVKADTNNALIDTGGGSHLPLAYDFEGGPIQSRPLLGEAKFYFAIQFSVPESTQPKELVFTLKTNDWQEKGKDVPVSLRAGQKPTSAHTAGDVPEQRVKEAVPASSGAGTTSAPEDTAMNFSLSK